MRVLVACEFSGIVRDAFAARGHDAWSCDLLPSEKPGQHIQGDVITAVYLPFTAKVIDPRERWDLVIAHPPCTRLCNSGVRWLHERGLWDEMRGAACFFRLLANCPAERVCAENPVMHKYAIGIVGRRPDQYIQPWQFGHGETKKTGLWLKNLPKLEPTNIVEGREARVHRMPPGPNRWKERSRTYQGVAEAMADQWGAL